MWLGQRLRHLCQARDLADNDRLIDSSPGIMIDMPKRLSVAFLLPDDLDAATGGYAYARQLISQLCAFGDLVKVHPLRGNYPNPDANARARAAVVLASLDDGQTTLIDGLALGVLASEVAEHARRLDLVALVHHPLHRETGLGHERKRDLIESERAALAHCSRVIATSAATAQELIAGLGVAADRVYVATPGTRRRAAAVGSDGPALQLLCVGSIVPRKGHLVLLEALASLTTLDWSCACIGALDRDTKHVNRVRQRIDELGLAGRIKLLGALDDAALDAAWSRSDLFVLATEYEGYGMAFAEALAAGLPIIGTTGAVVPQLAMAGARLIAPGDLSALRQELAELIGDASLRARLARAASLAAQLLPSWLDTAMALRWALQRSPRSALPLATLPTLPASGHGEVAAWKP